jgi:hypothetical protein
MRAFQILGVLVGVGFVAAGLVVWMPPSDHLVSSDYGGLLAAGSSLAFVSVAAEVFLRRSHPRLEADRRALQEVLSLVRETEGVVSARENWSVLERAQFRIRLSRLATPAEQRSRSLKDRLTGR